MLHLKLHCDPGPIQLSILFSLPVFNCLAGFFSLTLLERRESLSRVHYAFICAEWRDVLRLCIVNDGPEATSSILGHRSNKLSKSFWICMYGLKLPMKNFSYLVSNAFSVSLSVDSISVLLHWSTVSFAGNQMDLSLWARHQWVSGFIIGLSVWKLSRWCLWTL